MHKYLPTCIKVADANSKCPICKLTGIKNGKTKNGIQRFHCKKCGKYYPEKHLYQAYNQGINNWIKQLIKEGCGIRSTARLLGISTTTLLKRIVRIAECITKPPILDHQEYELDELCTYLSAKHQQVWIVYAIHKDTKTVIDFSLGNRTKENLNKIVQPLLLYSAKRICTDKLLQYKSLIPASIHNTQRRCTNHIERMNLNLRTHLKRLNRKTICFSRSIPLLSACLKIYFWG